jgi:membrane fusion protein (multidrug efflux system)
MVAEFAPSQAVGRIAPGQRARVRLEGFPWAQHGTVPGSVSQIGSEMRDGRIRVELALDAARSPIPLRHGLPGTVEVEVERVSPALLVLRAAGKLLEDEPAGAPTATPTPADSARAAP